MADPDCNHNPGDKRAADSKPEERKPPKVRRFDMKTRVPKAPKSDTASSADSQNEDDRDVAASRDKCIVVTAVVTKGERARTLTQKTALPAVAKSGWSAEISQRLAPTAETAGDGRKQDDSGQADHPVPLSHDPAADPMSVNRMFQTSLELQQQAEKDGRREERGSSGLSHHRNIVDQLFQDFVSTKMREVDEGARGLAGEESASSGTEMDGEKEQSSVSMDEISRLLDAEITSIKSRSEVPELTALDLLMLTGGNGRDRTMVNSENVNPQSITAEPDCESVTEWVDAEPADFLAPQSLTLSVAEVFADADDTFVAKGSVGSGSQETSRVEVKGGPLLRKKPEVKKLGLSIGAVTLARIVGNFKNGHFLEEGEVASSTDSDGDKAFKTDRKAEEEEEEEESENSDEVSGTGSLSDSDKGKDGKTKKRKKHKHKHKKKKKHKSQSKEKERGEEEKKEGEGEEEHSASTERKSSKEKKGRKSSRDKSDRKSSKEGKEKEDGSKESRSKDKDRKKSSHHSTKGDELFDPWDARNYREDALKRSRSRSPHSSKSKHKDRSKEGEHSKEKPKERTKERHHRKHKSRSRERSSKRSHSKEKDKQMSAKDKEKEESDLRVKIDKNKLRKFAIARTLANMEKGKCPSVNLTTIKSGGKSVAELTEFCKQISQKESLNDSSDSPVSDEAEESEAEEGPLHHPFIMRDPSTLPNIIMNIRNAKQLPILSPQEKVTQAATLRTQFPVSSGTQHRNKESEWVPVTTGNTTTTTTTTNTSTTTMANSTPSTNPVAAAAAAVLAIMPAPPVPAALSLVAVGGGGGGGGGGGVMPGTSVGMPGVSAGMLAPSAAPLSVDSVFPPTLDINIGAIISERIHAMRRLEQNPFDMQALSSVHKVNEQANMWAQSKHLPGQFTGTTDVKILTQQELAGPDKRNQAWVKKDQFRRAPPLRGGIGMLLLQKMGWKPGDGLGKDNEGKKEPLMLDVKMDRKGLTTSLDHRPAAQNFMMMMMRPSLPGLGTPGFGPLPGAPRGPLPGAPRGPLLMAPGTPRCPLMPGVPAPAPARAKDLSGKHPVSALTELCTKRRWGAPAFDLISESGPAHKKMFLFKVRVNGVEYMPPASCGNKKLAKAQAAAVCLQEMGLIPRDFVVSV